jgi:hypothetical protein
MQGITMPNSCDDQNQISAAQTTVDGCPVLPKLQCHEVSQGQDARLIWNFKNESGSYVDLSTCTGSSCSESDASDVSFDDVGDPDCGIALRMRELSGYNASDQIFSIDAEVLEASTGKVRAAALPDALVRSPGVYLEEWAVMTSDKRMLFSNQCITFIRPGLFGIDNANARTLGPPSVQDIRLSLRDNSNADNTLLDDVEFDSSEIAQAVLRPIQFWNEIPPPINPLLTTKTYPFKEIWLLGIQAYLLETAAHNYRRNQLAYSAGGISVDDKNKEQAYSAASARLMQRFQDMTRAKKIEVNISLFSGSIGSPYSGLFY